MADPAPGAAPPPVPGTGTGPRQRTGQAAAPARQPPRRTRPRPSRRERTKGTRGSLVAYLIVLAGVACGLGWVLVRGTHGVRGGTFALAGAMFAGALARLVLPESRAGMLASRSRMTDVATFLALSAGLLAVGLML